MHRIGPREKSSPASRLGVRIGARTRAVVRTDYSPILLASLAALLLAILSFLTGCTAVHGASAPTAKSGGPYAAYTNAPVNFNGSGSSDPQGDALTYAWNFGDGGTATGASPTHTYTTVGNYNVSLTVTDQHNLSSTDTTTATVQAPKPPVANAGGPYTGVPGTAITLTAAASTDPQNQTLTYAWSFGDGTTGTGVSPTHTYANAGAYTATVTVTNQSSLATTASATVTIALAAQPPVANAGGPYTGTSGTAISFSAAASTDPKNEPLTYAWSFGDGGTATGVTPTHTYTAAGKYTVTVTVKNTDGLTASASTTATVTAPAQPPVANAGGPYTGTSGTAVTFSGAASTDPRGETLTYAWNFGDGGTATGVSPTHTYIAAGTFTVTLTVTNTDSLTASASTTATITAPGQSPVANAGGPYSGVAGTAITLSAAASTDPKNETLTYAWDFGDKTSGSGVSPTHTYSAAGTYTVSLTVTNTDKLSATATAVATITAAPQAPTANAGGPYTGTVGNLITFTGAASSDPRNETLTYAWDFGDKSSGSGIAPTHAYTAAGAYTVTLTVTNTDKLSATATAVATVTSVPQAPTANAGGPYTGSTGTAVAFNGSASTDPKSETLTYAWDFGDKSNGTGVAPTHTYTTAGTYTVTLTVTNTDNLTAAASTTATITAPAQSPTAVAGGPYTGVAGTAIAFNGSASTDPKSETLTYTWNFGDGGAGSGATPTHTYSAAGTYTVSLTVTNTDKLSATATATATITAAPSAPVANPGVPYTGTAGTAVAFTGSASSDPKGETLTYAWNFGDGNSGTGATPSHTYSAAGSYTVTLTVTNTDNLSASATTTATIAAAPQAPTANAGGPYTGATGKAIAFTGAASTDPRSETLTYSWDFGDKTALGTGVNPTHTYTTAGTYTVTLTVTNTDNLSATATAVATITAAPQAPTANAGGPYTGTAGTAIAFTGAASTDPQNQTLAYSWDFGDKTTLGTGATPTHIYTTAGSYTATLTVTNTSGLTNAATAAVTVAAAPSSAPTAVINGPYTGTTNAAIGFTATGSSDPQKETLTYAWNFGDGAASSAFAPTHAYTAAGTYTVSLTVTNTDGKTGSASTTATITAPTPQPPTVTANGPYEGTTGTPTYFTALGSSDPANPNAGAYALTLAWSFGDGSTGTGPTPVHTYSKAGSYTATVTGTTSAGASASASAAVTITAATPISGQPTANANGPYTAAVNTAIQFSSTGSSDPNNLTLTFNWDFGDGTSGAGASPTHAYAAAGNYSVVLTVSNGTSSAVASTVATITAAAAAAMTANAGGPYTIAQGQILSFTAIATNPNNRQLTYTWDFGDGVPGNGPNPTHIYIAQGSYTATLNVTDGSTGNANATAMVTVTAPPAEAITATAGGPYADVTGHAIILDASASQDNLGQPLTYTWNFGDGSTAGTGATLAHAYTTAGSYTATVTVASASVTQTATATVTISASLGVTITSPTNNSLTGTATTTVTGTLPSSGLSVAVNGIAATVSGTSYTASGVSLREGVNLITATATDGKGGIGTAATSVILDVTAPGVSITSPAANATVSTPSISVAGLVNDIVTGTVGSNNVTVTVNGIAAQVANRSYMLGDVTLVPGANTITVVAKDLVGNTGSTSITVNYLPPVNQLSLNVFSGSGQTAQVQNVLTQPLVVQLLAANGTPVAGRPITFTVTRSDGTVEVLPTIAQSLYVNTDATGKASVLFKLGSRVGLGINQVTATTPGAAGSALFFESSTASTPAQILMVRGENQRGLLGQPLAEGLQTIVEDTYGNAIPGVTVTYTVAGGDGTLDNQNVTTDANGKALANLTLGQQEGVSNYAVTADFANDPSKAPVTFLASGYAPGAVANTSVSGQVLDNSNQPVVNATVRLLNTTLSATTDTNGNFNITGAPVGTVTLSVDGSTSTSTQTFPFLSFVLESLPGQNNTLNKPIFLPSIDADNAQTVGGDDPVTITMANVPGVSFTVAPHSVTFPDGTTVGKLSVSQVNSNMVPMEPTNGSSPNLIWTLQPAGARFSTPVTVTFPNTQGLAPGTVTEFYQYDHDLEQFVSAGTAHVSADGSTLLSDAGFGITKAGWGHILTATDPGSCVESCISSDPCITAKLFANCVCATFANPGAACGAHNYLNLVVGTNPDGSDRIMQIEQSCKLPGKCDNNGKCNGMNSPAGTNCPPPNFCDLGGKCNGNGSCIAGGTIQPVQQIDNNGDGLFANAQLNLTKELTLVEDVLSNLSGGHDPIITIQPSVTGQNTKTIVCCEATKQKNVENDDSTITPGVTVQTVALPVVLPNGVELGYTIPGFGDVGIYWKLGGSLQGTYKKSVDNCAMKNCTSFGISPSLNITGILQFGTNPYVTANLTAAIGIQLGASAGCGTISLTGGLTPITVQGSVTLLNFAQVNGGFTFAIPYSSVTATLDTNSGDLTFTTPHLPGN